MAQLTMRQVAGYALAAGFTGEAAAKAVAVAWAESTGKTNARNVNSDAHRSVDRGLWQINSYWHREVSDQAADDPARAAAAVYRISNGGADWSQWATWPSPATSHLPKARTAVGNPAPVRGGVTPVGNPLAPDNGLPGVTNLPGWLGFLGGAAAETAAAETARDAAMELVRAAAPALLTVALVGGGLALVAVGLNVTAKGSSRA